MLTSVYDEKLKPMLWGFLDYDENIDSVLAELKAAGLDTLLRSIRNSSLNSMHSRTSKSF